MENSMDRSFNNTKSTKRNSLEELVHKLILPSIIIDDDITTSSKNKYFLSSSSSSSSSYVIVLQHSLSYSVRNRIIRTGSTAAASGRSGRSIKNMNSSNKQEIEETEIYRRAKIRTPFENAFREYFGGTLFIQYIVNIILKEQKQQQQKSLKNQQQHINNESDNDSDTFMIWVSTRTSGSNQLPPWMQQLADDSIVSKKNIRVIDSCCNDSLFDADTKLYESNNNESSSSLRSLFNDIKRCIEEMNHSNSIQYKNQKEVGGSRRMRITRRIPIVIESLSPLIMIHGYNQTISFLQQLKLLKLNNNNNNNSTTDGCIISNSSLLLFIPATIENLSIQQHRCVEDIADAVLTLGNTDAADVGGGGSAGGEMELFRHGVRDYEYIVREMLPFRILNNKNTVSDKNTNNDKHNYNSCFQSLKLLIGENDDFDNIDNNLEQEQGESTTTKNGKHQQQKDSSKGSSTTEINSSKSGGRQKVSLKMDEGAIKNKNIMENNTTPQESSVVKRPMIYLEDDDPEFDDYDEEDPDDDLDI